MTRQYDLTKGNIPKQLIAFWFPIMFTNLLQVSYQFIDSFWGGNLIGENSLAAVAVASTVIYTILSFIIGMNNVTLTIFSQQQGKTTNAAAFLFARLKTDEKPYECVQAKCKKELI
ncbi:hypothetical protein DER53_12545 [Parageobacillus toebii NBRC 107807]|uniref:Na+-driven multidrug efflux pump n=1 Tax=Parageobacillus toebii NBRC 107807 TaxID=1223503 RepID=A0A6G9J5I7_9BACL|nr:Na+-driven multidrug efflux pump [Parageobacillus toebii NBRC 107807]QIQ33497.1 hypothetical protein DER53_12545 [Parageobacillus toebii NBRC 107807]